MKSISNFVCFRSLLLKTHQLPLDAYVVALKGMKVNKAILKGSLRRLDREITVFLRLVSYSNASCRKTKGLEGM